MSTFSCLNLIVRIYGYLIGYCYTDIGDVDHGVHLARNYKQNLGADELTDPPASKEGDEGDRGSGQGESNQLHT